MPPLRPDRRHTKHRGDALGDFVGVGRLLRAHEHGEDQEAEQLVAVAVVLRHDAEA